MRERRQISVPLKTTVLAGGMIALAVTATLSWRVYQLRQDTLADVHRDLRYVTQVAASRVERLLDIADLVLMVAVAESSVSRENPVLSSVLDRTTDLAPLGSVAIADARGRVMLQRGEGISSGTSVANARFFRTHQDDPSLQTAVAAEGNALVISRRVADSAGTLLGVAFAVVDFSGLRPWVAPLGDERGRFALYHADGQLLWAETPLGASRRPAFLDDARSLAAASTAPRITGIAGREPFFAVYQEVPHRGVVVEVTAPVTAALRPWRTTAWVLSLVAGVLLVVVAGSTYLTAREFLRHDGRTRMALEAAARARDEAETASRAKSVFLSQMSHELRTPLNAIIGFSQFLGAGFVGSLSAKQNEYLKDVEQSALHLLRLVDDLLDLTRLEIDALPLRDEMVDLYSIVGECLRMVEAQAIEKNVSLEHGATDVHRSLRADVARVRQIVLNLLTNAVRYTPAGGSVRIDVRRDTDGSMSVQIADTGPGMTEDELRTALEPFKQVDPFAVASRAGAGLGLPVTKALLERHGGELILHSRRGAGTTAIARFPPDRSIEL